MHRPASETRQSNLLKIATLCMLVLIGCRVEAPAQSNNPKPSKNGESRQTDSRGLIISDGELPPNTYLQARYEYRFSARGEFAPPVRWRVIGGALPPGLRLEDDGLLHGEPTRTGEFRFTVSATDTGKPAQAVQREFVIRVIEALVLEWKVPAHVTGNRIEGSVDVSNTTRHDVDLTFIVEAVAENGRATAIGYQHFLLRRGTRDMELPFGETLPHGAYLINVDGIGEITSRNVIYRQRLVMPKPLNVAVGP